MTIYELVHTPFKFNVRQYIYSEPKLKSHSYFNWYVLVFPLQSKCERYIFQKMYLKMAQSRHCIHARLIWKLMTKKPCMKNALKKRNTIKRQYNTMHFISRLQNLYPRDFWVVWYSESTTTKHFVRIHRSTYRILLLAILKL